MDADDVMSMIDQKRLTREQVATLLTALVSQLVFWDHRPADAPKTDQLMDIDEAAVKMRKSKDWLYRNWRKLPFAVRVGHSIRFSENGADRWIAAQTGVNGGRR